MKLIVVKMGAGGHVISQDLIENEEELKKAILWELPGNVGFFTYVGTDIPSWASSLFPAQSITKTLIEHASASTCDFLMTDKHTPKPLPDSSQFFEEVRHKQKQKPLPKQRHEKGRRIRNYKRRT